MKLIPAQGLHFLSKLSLWAGISVLCAWLFPVRADNINYPAGARSSGVANASVTFTDGWGAFNNQGGLAFLTSPVAGFHFENRFLLKEMSMKAGMFALPLKTGTLAVSARYFGYSKYYESKFGLAYGLKFTDRFAAGVQINYLQTHIADGYGNYNAVAAEIGLLAEPADNFFVGAHVFNPTMTRHNAYPEERIPTVFRLGARYSFEERASVLFETEKEVDYKPFYKLGIEVQAINNFFLRCGYSTDIRQYSFGLGYKYRRISADLAFSRHYLLGFTPHASLSYEF